MESMVNLDESNVALITICHVNSCKTFVPGNTIMHKEKKSV